MAGGGACSCCRTNGVYIVGGVFIAIIIVYSFATGLSYPKSTENFVQLGLSETRIVSFSTTWYGHLSGSAVSLNDKVTNSTAVNNDVTLMSFLTRPPLTVSDSWQVNETAISIDKFNYLNWAWFFYAGSTLRATWNFTQPIHVYVIKSADGYNTFYSNNGDPNMAVVQPFIVLANSAANGSISFTVPADDFYYLIFENWDLPNTVSGDCEFSITSLLLDTSNPTQQCSLPCSLVVPYKTTTVYVLRTPSVSAYASSGQGSPLSAFSFTLFQPSRKWFVVVILFFVPILVIFSLGAAIIAYMKRDVWYHGKSKGINLDEMPSFYPSGNTNLDEPSTGGAIVQ